MVMNHDRGCLGPRFFSFVYDNGDGTVRSLTLRGRRTVFFFLWKDIALIPLIHVIFGWH